MFPDKYKLDDALALLQESHIPSLRTTYGFEISDPIRASSNRPIIQCGIEHVEIASMSVRAYDGLSVNWFFRFDFLELAQLILDAYRTTGDLIPFDRLVANLKKIDSDYDRKPLDEWCRLREAELKTAFPSHVKDLLG